MRRPEGQGLNDLYVRFFRMAERRIAEMTGRGVVCFISNYSWLDGLSFTGMRERYLEAFDAIRIDCLQRRQVQDRQDHARRRPRPQHLLDAGGCRFRHPGWYRDHHPGAQDRPQAGERQVGFRHLWGKTKREEADRDHEGTKPDALYDSFEPSLPLGLPFARMEISDGWHEWPALTDLFPASFPGVKTGRDPFVVDIDLNRSKCASTTTSTQS